MKKPKFSIIVVYQKKNKFAEECIEHCLKLDCPSFEIIAISNENDNWDKRVEIHAVGDIPPSEKRDIGAKIAKGEMLAFIDDDAYPKKDWLKKAEKYFESEEVAAIGGPGVTPHSDNISQKAGGYIYSSWFGASPSMRYRYIQSKEREVDDYATCNFIVRKDIFKKIGGFDTKYWPGEDTKFCLDLTKKFNKKIIYAPDVIVYHHRRPLFRKHLKQIKSYGIHRGLFAKKFPETSFRLVYFLPSLFVLGLVFGWVSYFIHPFLFKAYAVVVSLYFLTIFINSVFSKNLVLIPFVFTGTFLTHLWYGIAFIHGILNKDLSRVRRML